MSHDYVGCSGVVVPVREFLSVLDEKNRKEICQNICETLREHIDANDGEDSARPLEQDRALVMKIEDLATKDFSAKETRERLIEFFKEDNDYGEVYERLAKPLFWGILPYLTDRDPAEFPEPKELFCLTGHGGGQTFYGSLRQTVDRDELYIIFDEATCFHKVYTEEGLALANLLKTRLWLESWVRIV